MSRVGTWWTHQRWGPVGGIAEYRRDRVVDLVQGGTIVRPTADELRLASEYVSWRQRQLWRTVPSSAAIVLVFFLVPPIPRSVAWNFAFLSVLGALLQARRVRRWRKAVDQREANA